jgi:hypothetical protein
MSCCNKIKGAIKLAQSELGVGISPPDLTAERRKICEGCPEWEHGKCRVCGCYTFAKTRLTKETCPLGKW